MHANARRPTSRHRSASRLGPAPIGSVLSGSQVAYCLAITIYCLNQGPWTAVPFLALLDAGFGYVAALSWLGRWRARIAPATAPMTQTGLAK